MGRFAIPAMALAAILAAAGPAAPQANCNNNARVAVGVTPPPPLAEQAQPPIPGYGYVWTPGYWAWNPSVNDYYWAPGVWVLPPRIGYLWTPPWWGWDDGVYVFNAGYWGPTIGWYGGVDYGYGYYGHGYEGGYWRGNTFWYNRGVNNFGGARFNAVYERPHIGRGFSHVSYNGGPGGLRERPTPQELAAAREPHIGATAPQASHFQAAAGNSGYRAGPNHGHPILAAAGGAVAGAVAMHALSHRGAETPGRGVVGGRPERVARGAPYHGALHGPVHGRTLAHEAPRGSGFIHAGPMAGREHVSAGFGRGREAFGAGGAVRAEPFRAPPAHAAPAFHGGAPAGRPMAAPHGGGEGRRH